MVQVVKVKAWQQQQLLLVSFACASEEMQRCYNCHRHRGEPVRGEASIADVPLQQTAASSETGRTSFAVGSQRSCAGMLIHAIATIDRSLTC